MKKALISIVFLAVANIVFAGGSMWASSERVVYDGESEIFFSYTGPEGVSARVYEDGTFLGSLSAGEIKRRISNDGSHTIEVRSGVYDAATKKTVESPQSSNIRINARKNRSTVKITISGTNGQNRITDLSLTGSVAIQTQPKPQQNKAAGQNPPVEQARSQNQQSDTNNAPKTEPPPAASTPVERTITSRPRTMPEPTIQTVDSSLIEAARQAQQRRAAGDVWDTKEGEGGLVITYYRDTEKVIQIPEKINGRPVVAIGEGAFDREGLTSVTIPPTVISIGEEAFANNELHSIVIPPGVKYIGDSAFHGNELVYGITIGANVELGRNAIGEEGTEYDFVDFYTRNGKKAGTYTLTETDSGWKWNYRAIADYDQAIRLDSNDAHAYNRRGIAYANKKDYDRAIADYSQAIQLDPEFVAAYSNRGNAYKNKGDYDRAFADYDQAIRLDPEYAAAYIGRGLGYANKKDYDRAIADYSQAIRLDPEDPEYAVVYNNRSYAYAMKGDYARSRADAEQVLRLDPGNTWARDQLAWLRKQGY
jgi:tetratricopeptide (TPR) repeat protein